MIEVERMAIGIAFRVTSTPPDGSRKKMTAHDVINAHWKLSNANSDGCVAFSTNIPLESTKVKNIDKIIFFSNTEKWACIADVFAVDVSDKAFIPDFVKGHPEWIPPEFPEPRKTWFVVKNFERCDIDSLDYKIPDGSGVLKDKVIGTPRFSRVYFELR